MRLSVREAASYLGVPERDVRRWVRDGTLPAIQAADRQFLDAVELWEWATRRGMVVSRHLLDDLHQRADAPTSLATLIEAGGIVRDVPGASRDEVLRAVVARLPLPDEVDREFLLEVLEAREALGSTGIGDGIAIPHVRNPIVLHLDQPLVMIALLHQPVDFAAPDGRPVTTLFTIITPDIPTHLAILGRLALVLRDPDLRRSLTDRATAQDIVSRIDMIEHRETGAFRIPERT
jgi:PTS system nitrogen regulatory IIA component